MHSGIAWLSRKGVPNWLALLVVVGGGIVVVLAVVAFLGTSLTDFSRKLPAYQTSLTARTESVTTWLKDHGVDVVETINLDGLDPNRMMKFAGTILGTLGSLSSDVFIVLLMFMFLLVEVSGFRAKLQAMPSYSPSDDDRLGKILEDIRHYLAIKTQMSLCTGILAAIWLAVLGVDYVLLWGLLAFLFNFVPNIGSVIAAIPPVLLALVQPGLGPAYAIYTALGYVAINVLLGNVLEPRLMGRGLGLSTLVVFLSLVFWGWVLGPVGMFLSVPLTMMAKIAMDRSEDTRWIAILLASQAPDPVEMHEATLSAELKDT